MRETPTYGYLCLTCGGLWSEYIGKHSDPDGHKCRDITGNAANPSKLGPVAERPWGPDGILAELRWEANYDHGWAPPPREHVEQHISEGLERINSSLAFEPTPESESGK